MTRRSNTLLRVPASACAFGAAVFFFIALIAHRDAVGGMVWMIGARRLTAPIALALAHRDAPFALAIGNFYLFTDTAAYDLDAAERAYRKALRIDPGIASAHYQLAAIHFTRGEHYHALKEINRELELHPSNTHAHYIRGLIHGYVGNYFRAEEDFAAYVAAHPDSWAGYNDLGWIQTKLGKFEEVKKTVSAAFTALPHENDRNPWLWISRGIADLNLKNYTEARVALLRARAISDGMNADYFWAAYPANDPRNAEEAFSQFRSTLAFNLGIVHERLEEWAEAVAFYEEYLAFQPEYGPYPKREAVTDRIREIKVRFPRGS